MRPQHRHREGEGRVTTTRRPPPSSWATIYPRRKNSAAPRGTYSDPKPDPVPKDTEAELNRLAEERAERARDLAALLALEDE